MNDTNDQNTFKHVNLPRSVRSEIEKSVIDRVIASNSYLADEITRCFANQLRGLTRFQKRRSGFQFEVIGGSEEWRWRITLERGQLKWTAIFVDLDKPSYDLDDAALQVSSPPNQDDIAGSNFDLREIQSSFVTDAIEYLFEEVGTDSYYLPVARSGVLQSHRVIASSLVRRSRRAGLEEVSIPTLSGLLTDFISHLLTLDADSKTDLSTVVDELEREVLTGQVVVSPDFTDYPEFVYRKNRVEYPMAGASSMVPELAPVVMLLRSMVERGETLIIEEPESHLHPDSQRKMAHIVAKIVGMGVRTIVTTHSDYFLEELGNIVTYSGLSKGRKAEFPSLKDSDLAEKDVGLYLFEPRSRPVGTHVRSIPVSAALGLQHPDTTEVAEQLYDDMVRLRDALGSNS